MIASIMIWGGGAMVVVGLARAFQAAGFTFPGDRMRTQSRALGLAALGAGFMVLYSFWAGHIGFTVAAIAYTVISGLGLFVVTQPERARRRAAKDTSATGGPS